MRSLLGLVLLMSAGAASAADRFDLVCSTRQSKAPMRFRVDLAARQYCNGATACNVQSMADLTPTRITFDAKDTPSGKIDSYVDRVTGNYWYMSRDPKFGTFIDSGHCVPAPFSGFPTAKF